jgi:magnesium chelatase subunit I
MNIKSINTLGELRKSGYKAKTIKEEVRLNLIGKLQAGATTFPGILGYQDTVIPDTERALLSRHNILFLGLRGQAKTRMARQMVDLLDEYIPIVLDSPLNDNPLAPISNYAKQLIATKGDDTPITWLHRNDRYAEKLATPDVSVADLIGDIDPIKAANLKLSLTDEEVIHYGIIPRSNRGIFVINELPDLQARIQVGLFNILQEGDVQIRGFKLRLPLDILFVFTANPEDYTNRGSIVTPLKDRIESQILTHYPKQLEEALGITEQEAHILPEQNEKIQVNDLVKRLIEQIAFEARASEYVDKKSGVSARLTIAAYESAVSAAERRMLIHKEKNSIVFISDLLGIIPAINGKIELLYEGEMEGPLQVSLHLLDKAIRTQFVQYFPNPTLSKKRASVKDKKQNENPYASITQWFDKGNKLNVLVDGNFEQRKLALYAVDGLDALVKKYFNAPNEAEHLLLMEFVLFGLATYSQVSKTIQDNTIAFKDLMGSMLNFGANDDDADDDYEE